MSIETTEREVLRLPPRVLELIELKNAARREAGLERIKVTVRMCIACDRHFETVGNRTCGCTRTPLAGEAPP